MRELTLSEVEDVSGGFLPWLIVGAALLLYAEPAC